MWFSYFILLLHDFYFLHLLSFLEDWGDMLIILFQRLFNLNLFHFCFGSPINFHFMISIKISYQMGFNKKTSLLPSPFCWGRLLASLFYWRNHIMNHLKKSAAHRAVDKKHHPHETPELLLGVKNSGPITPQNPCLLNNTPLPLRTFYFFRLLASMVPWRQYILSHHIKSSELRAVWPLISQPEVSQEIYTQGNRAINLLPACPLKTVQLKGIPGAPMYTGQLGNRKHSLKTSQGLCHMQGKGPADWNLHCSSAAQRQIETAIHSPYG